MLPDLKNKHILLDTCFIIKAYEYSHTAFFDELFSALQENNCVPVINEFIKFEFLRGCKIIKHIQDKDNFLDALSGVGMSLPIDQYILNDATRISIIYSNKNVKNKHINAIDCYISAYLKRYEKNLIFVTLNNDDYPLLLHYRLGIYPIDTEKEILVLGFYKFNNNKFQTAMRSIK